MIARIATAAGTPRAARRLGILGALLVVFGSTALHAQEDTALVEVADAAWTSNVANLQFTDRYGNGETMPQSPIYLWTRMKASERALAQLRTAGKLPIKHYWRRYVGTGTDLEKLDAISLGVGNPEVVRGLEREVTENGYFDWRTWSKKDHVRSGGWEVRIVYNDGKPVLCADHDGPTMVPCRYYVWLR
jgi:hypothetical protein